MFAEFPLEIWVKISYQLDRSDIYALALTRKSMYSTMTSDPVWWPKVRKSWYMTDYNPRTLSYKKKLKHNESCFEYFQRKKHDDQYARSCIDQIIHYTPHSNERILEKLHHIYNNFDAFVPCLLSESLHLTSSLFGPNGYIAAEDFTNLQKRRNANLARVYVASNILESGKFFKCVKAAEYYNKNMPVDLESVLVELSLLDSRYHELILIRHSVIKSIICNYNSFDFENTAKPIEKIMFLVRIMHRVIDSKKKKILAMSQTSQPKTTIEDLSILRFYAGDSEGTPMIKNAVVEKLCIMLNLNKYIEINECCIRILDNDKYMYLFIDGDQMYLKKESDVHEILRKFPMEDPGFVLLRSASNNITELTMTPEYKKRAVYMSKFITYYDNFYGSRLDDLRGADQIIYQMVDKEKIVVVHRYNYIQGQILCCGGYVNKHAWIAFKSLFLTGQLEDTKFISIFTLPIITQFKNHHNINVTYDQLFLKEMSYDIKDSDILNLEERNDIITECDHLSVGDVVWSESSQARGVVVEISDSQEDAPDTTTKINLFNASTLRRKSITLNGSPLFTVFFGAYGFATFTKQYLKCDKTDRVEGLLVYDLLGRWFSHYDYGLHKFVYRHDQFLLNY